MGGDVAFQEINAVLTGHFHVQRDHIGGQLCNFLLRIQGVNGMAYDFDTRMDGKTVHDHAASHHRIVNNQDADFLRCS